MSEQPVSPDVHASSGAYVLDALDPQERRAFERHLATCDTCQAEVAEMTEAASTLSLLVEQPPPADLLAKVLTQTRTIRQLPPLESTDVVASRVDELAVRRARASARIARWVGAVAAAVALVAGGGWIYSHQQLEDARTASAVTQVQLADAQAQQAATQAILAAPDLETATAPVSSGGNGSVLASASQGQMLFVAGGLQTLDPSKTYQLWLIDSAGKPTSAGTFQPTAGGARQLVRGNLSTTKVVGLTVEPDGGSKAPTTTPIFAPTLAG